jgi:hypothetical protein
MKLAVSSCAQVRPADGEEIPIPVESEFSLDREVTPLIVADKCLAPLARPFNRPTDPARGPAGSPRRVAAERGLAAGGSRIRTLGPREREGVDESCRTGSVPGPLAHYGLVGVSGTTAGTPSGLMLKARKVRGSLPGLPHWWTRPEGS